MTPHTKVFTTQHGHLHNTTMKCFLVALGSGAAATQHNSIKPPSARNHSITHTHTRTHAHAHIPVKPAGVLCYKQQRDDTAFPPSDRVVYLQCLLSSHLMRHLNNNLMY